MNNVLKIAAAGLTAIALTACVEGATTRSDTGLAQPKVDIDDLRIGSASRAESELENRGFVAVDGSQSDSGFSHLIMYNRRTGQCVDLETSGPDVMTLNEVTHPNCR